MSDQIKSQSEQDELLKSRVQAMTDSAIKELKSLPGMHGRLVRSIFQLCRGMGFNLDFSSVDAANIRVALISGQEMIRMVLEDDPKTDNMIVRSLWDKAHNKD